ncbi:MAG TPA: AzlD domain-containing protein [Methylomirabilota bacterium]|nr:AzlD domain-containing protein [Methylomirabilota bacterium]
MMHDAYPWLVLLAGAGVTYAWRGMGVLLSGRIDAEGPLFRWIGAVAYALLAALIARMIVLPIGPLAATALVDRLGAAAAALLVFLLTRRSLLFGVLAGAAVLVLLTSVQNNPMH